MELDFTSAMAKLSDSELLKIVTEQRDQYQPTALAAADKEFQNRNLSQQQIETVKGQLQTEKAITENRASESLARKWKVILFLFGGWFYALLFYVNFKSNGYEKKANDIKKWSLYGLIFYISLFVIFYILNAIIVFH